MGRSPSAGDIGQVFRPYIKHPKQIEHLKRLAVLLSESRCVAVSPSDVVCEALNRNQSLTSWIAELEADPCPIQSIPSQPIAALDHRSPLADIELTGIDTEDIEPFKPLSGL